MKCVWVLIVDPKLGVRGPDNDDSEIALCKSLLCPRGRTCFSILVVRRRPGPPGSLPALLTGTASVVFVFTSGF